MDRMPPGPVLHIIVVVRDFASDLVVWAGSVVRHALVVFGGALVTFALFATEHQRGEAYSWRSAEWIIGGSFVIALFLAWREKYRAWRDQCAALAVERDSKLPKFVAYVRYITKGTSSSVDTPIFFAGIEIRNDGFRSVVKDFCPAVTINGREHLGQLAITSEKVTVTMPDGTKRVVHERDAIYNVTKTPIEPGDLRAGHLHFYFDNAIGDVNKHRVRIYFRDYRNTTFSTEPIEDKDTFPATALPHPDGMFSSKQLVHSEEKDG